ncbi:MAG: PIN domain-containing protein [Bacillota bacterium]|nr:PIN domain-containing protein [Bacillota bacterium]
MYVIEHKKYPIQADHAGKILQLVENGELMGITSVVNIMELLVLPEKEGRKDLFNKYMLLLKGFPNLKISDINQEIAELAAKLRGKYLRENKKLLSIDALCIATSILNNATAFVSNDLHLSFIRELEIINLEKRGV